MTAEDLISLLVPATYLVMLAVEARWPARPFPPRRGWRWMGGGFLVLIGMVGAWLPTLLPGEWLAAHRWFDGTGLGVAGGVLVGWPALTLLSFAWHRATHAFSPLWRFGHQMHHSPQRVDISGSALFHPAEMLVQVLLQTFISTVVLGLDPLAAAWIGYIGAFAGMFQHWNIHTPRWLACLIQRPEAHCEHHRMGVHAGNYSDFPLWDLLFGSFRNPAHFEGTCGFESPADRRLVAMLAFRDVNAPAYGEASLGVSRLRPTASATSIPSTPADMMPPA